MLAAKAGCRDALLEESAGRLNHDQPVGALHAGALHLVVENRIFVGGQVELRGVLHDARADVPRELVGQNRVEEVQHAHQDRRKSRQREFRGHQPPEVVRQRLSDATV